MLGDGKTSYDLGNDGDSNAIGSCSVRRAREVAAQSPLTRVFLGVFQANEHRNQTQDHLSEGRASRCAFPPTLPIFRLTGSAVRSKSITKLVSLRVRKVWEGVPDVCTNQGTIGRHASR